MNNVSWAENAKKKFGKQFFFVEFRQNSYNIFYYLWPKECVVEIFRVINVHGVYSLCKLLQVPK